MQGILYEENSVWTFLLVTCCLGGWVAWMTGRALAMAWRPAWQVLLWSVPLALVIRFIHFALFGGTLLNAPFYFVDLAVATAVAAAGFRFVRARQMTRQYRWLYLRTGPFTWRKRAQT